MIMTILSLIGWALIWTIAIAYWIKLATSRDKR